MNINLIALGVLALILGGYAWKAWGATPDTPQSHFLPFVPIDVRKNKVYVSKTKDAGMFVEYQRRIAILQNKPFVPSYKDSTNGYLEFGLTAIGFLPPKQICPAEPEAVIWSNGDADDQICDNVDAGGAFGVYDVVDFGGADANVCDP